jgi:hypothetical protein
MRPCNSGVRHAHRFGSIKARMGVTHFLIKTLRRVATEMTLHVVSYNLRLVAS